MRLFRLTGGLVIALVLAGVQALSGQELSVIAKTYRPRLATNLTQNIIPFWYPATVDRTNGGYRLNHDVDGRWKGPGTKMIVTQARMLWFSARLKRAGYGGQEFLDAAEAGYRFLKDQMWDARNGGFYWEV